MSTETQALAQAPAPATTSPEMIKGSDVVIKCLEREGVDAVFAYPGGASMELHQALTRAAKIRTILPRFEQGGGFMAHGYARATGKPGVCVATSGPGATNLVTCIADAYMDSIPLVAITGQVFQDLIGKSAFQETDFFGMTLPIVKHSYLVLNAEDLPRIIKEAMHIAATGRPGPVVIDIPKDVQQKVIPFRPDVPMSLPGYPEIPHASDSELQAVLDLISRAQRPVLYTGGGIISANASQELRDFADITGCPVASTLMGLGAFPATHPQSLYWFGMHGTVAGNWAVCDSDLLVTLGARFDDRITGTVSKFAPDATIVHFDIDVSEHNKNKPAHFPIRSEVRYALKRMCELARQGGFTKPDLTQWFQTINNWKKQHPFPFQYKPSKHILAQEAIEVLYQETRGEAIITTGVGQHQMWAPQYYHFDEPRTFLSSLGLGTMGFGLPAAIGAQVARPDKLVVNIDGDGCFLMNLQELATAWVEKLQWEDRFYEGVRGHTVLCDPENIGGPENLDGLYPDFVKLAEGFKVAGRRVHKREELRDAIREMIDTPGPFLLEVIAPYTEHVLPFIPQKMSAKDILTE